MFSLLIRREGFCYRSVDQTGNYSSCSRLVRRGRDFGPTRHSKPRKGLPFQHGSIKIEGQIQPTVLTEYERGFILCILFIRNIT